MTQDGGTAFPCGLQSGHLQPLHAGMSLRDYFAAKAMQGSLAEDAYVIDRNSFAKWCYSMADAMLAARKA